MHNNHHSKPSSFANAISKTITAKSSELLTTMQNLIYSAALTGKEYLAFSKSHNHWTKQMDRIYNNNTIKF